MKLYRRGCIVSINIFTFMHLLFLCFLFACSYLHFLLMFFCNFSVFIWFNCSIFTSLWYRFETVVTLILKVSIFVFNLWFLINILPFYQLYITLYWIFAFPYQIFFFSNIIPCIKWDCFIYLLVMGAVTYMSCYLVIIVFKYLIRGFVV